MANYAVTNARYNEERKLVAIQGQETHGHVADNMPGKSTVSCTFTVAEVLAAIDCGDAFYLTFGPFDKRLSGGLIISDGHGSLTEEQCIPGKRISDLPPF